MSAETTSEIEGLAIKLAGQSKSVGMALANRGDHLKRLSDLVRVVNVVVGISVVAITVVPEVHAIVGQEGARVASLVVSFVLILDTIVPLMVGEISPERYTDYARYILSYEGLLIQTLADKSLDSHVKQMRLIETMRLARKNIEDAVTSWPWLESPSK